MRTIDVDRSARELREEIHMTRGVLEARLHGATCEYAGLNALMGWAREVMEDLARHGGLGFPWS